MAPKKGQAAKSQSVFPSGWEWVEDLDGPVQIESITEAYLKSSFLFGYPKCEKNACRTNCKKNPSCINNLGEKFWFGEIQDNFWIDMEDPEEQRKQKGSHVGLKNLGATCYVNTFLQLWFHNLAFQSAIFQWVPAEGYNFSSTDETNQEKTKEEKCPEKAEKPDVSSNHLPVLETLSLPKFGRSVPDNICGNLQLLFALMKYSNKRFVDPAPFVQSLGLQTDEQQDAQEFSKLFMSLLEETLSNQESNVKSLVQDQFGGKYAYVTCCSKCGRSSKNESRFYELDLNIQGHCLLTECIKEFLKEEKLDGENKYFCTSCQQKQDATRKIVLQSLPPVLNLQLLRFVFDRNTGSKSKCNSVLKFPDTVDMNNFVKLDDPAHGIYELTAALIHVGNSASSGHYVAHILDKKDETWYKFNDEVVEKMQGKKLQLGAEDDPEGPDTTKAVKRSKTPKGIHSSKNAYMLVYSRKSELNDNLPDAEPADKVVEHVVKDNSLLDSWISEVQVIMEQKIHDGRERQKLLQEIYDNLQPKEDHDSEWVTTEWLRKLFNEKLTEIPPIDNSLLMCKHGKLDPSKLKVSKRISTVAGDILFKKYGGIPRFKIDSLCHKCVLDRAHQIQFEARLEKDKKYFSSALKSYDNSSDGFWVGKSSLKQWKQLATNSQCFGVSNEENIPPSPESSEGMHDCQDTAKTESQYCLSAGDVEIDAVEEKESIDTEKSSCKRKIEDTTPIIDAKLPKIQSEKSAFLAEDVVNGDVTTKPAIGSSQSDSIQSKAKLFNQDITCAEHGNLCLNENKRRLVSAEVWKRLRYYFKDCPEFRASESGCFSCQNQSVKKKEKREAFRVIANDMKSVLPDLYSDLKRPQPNIQETFEVYAVSKYTLEEWRYFVRFAKEPQYDLIENEDLICQHGKLLYNADDLINPRPEEEFTLLSKDEWELLSGFVPCDKEISIINIPPSEDDKNNMVAVMPECCHECRLERLNEDYENDKQFYYASIYVRKISNEETDKNQPDVSIDDDITPVDDSTEMICTNGHTEQASKKSSKKKRFLQPAKGSRQSTRHRTQRGEYAFRVDSSQTLKDFKIQLLSTFSVLPMDQHLSFENGTVIEDDTKTLGDLGIRPGCFLLLRADEPTENCQVMEEVTVNGERKLEEGFKGTGLYGAFSTD